MFKLILLALFIVNFGSREILVRAADSCDTYRHPIYGIGSCIDVSKCPNSLYISGLCESKPNTVKCCFMAGSSTSTLSCSQGQKLAHSTAYGHIRAAGLDTFSSGSCSDRNKPTCTSLDQINCKTIAEIINYKKASNCNIAITGGTETGHATATQSHWNGYKLDIGLSSCNDNYIKSI
jgi:hypothetical protein